MIVVVGLPLKSAIIITLLKHHSRLWMRVTNKFNHNSPDKMGFGNFKLHVILPLETMLYRKSSVAYFIEKNTSSCQFCNIFLPKNRTRLTAVFCNNLYG